MQPPPANVSKAAASGEHSEGALCLLFRTLTVLHVTTTLVRVPVTSPNVTGTLVLPTNVTGTLVRVVVTFVEFRRLQLNDKSRQTRAMYSYVTCLS